ncbi:MAG: DUF2842 domain-containing protein, partial [Paracoccaceae bacterium]
VILLIGLPVYIVASISILSLFERPSILLELFIYIALGILWALPFKYVFRGVGQNDPDQDNP